MTACRWCDQEMAPGTACHVTLMDIAGQQFGPVVWGEEARRFPAHWEVQSGSVCPGCGTPPRRPHHDACEVQECPRCGGAFLGCGCRDDERSDLGMDAASELD